MTGQVHSIESMGLVDGPGIRAVVFLQGCSLRCRYCHNPDTWAGEGGEMLTPEQLVTRLERFRPYFERSGGGVTFSGGEPLLQPEFLLECLRLCRERGLHTCLDTAGCGLGGYEELLRFTDLVLYDVKHFDPEEYQKLTGRPMRETARFVQALQKAGTPVWVRHVVVPGLTGGEQHLKQLYDFVRVLPNVQRVELLPYHLLGAGKYKAMEIQNPLEGVPAMDPEQCERWQEEWFGALNRERKK